MQPCIFRLGSDEDGDVRVGIFPKRQEILIGRLGFGGVALYYISAAKSRMRKCADGLVHNDAAMGEDFLELGSGFLALMCGQLRFPAQIYRIQSETERTVSWLSQLVRSSRLKHLGGLREIAGAY